MKIGGLHKFSLINYPEKTSAVIFTIGCNFRCSYCHNLKLVFPNKYSEEISIEEILNFLKSRQNKLDAVVISGGEPTEHSDLLNFISDIKELGFLIKLDTNGSNPNVLQEIIKNNLINYIAMDIKAPIKKHQKVTRSLIDFKKIKESINIIMRSEIEYEFRTTVVKELINSEDLIYLAKMIYGAEKYFLQTFNFSKSDLGSLNFSSYSKEEMEKMAKNLRKYVKECKVR